MSRIALPRRRERDRDLRWVVRIVVHDHDLPHLPHQLEPARHALEVPQSLGGLPDIAVQRRHYPDRHGRIPHVVQPGDADPEPHRLV